MDNDVKVVKVGNKGKHVKIPNGWEIKKSGVLSSHDKYVNIHTGTFDFVELEDLGIPVTEFELVIRCVDKNYLYK